ncbi:MAG: murein biosynthesis integral membrane protein MurJ, partial [Deltaproteobacteria bacterium]|nr:murein biosynthesis integral membrane protein MurJ [Deltaproteobacteria bacterium]
MEIKDSLKETEKMEKRHMGLAAGVVSFYTMISRVLGLVRDMVIASFFGATISADAFFVAFRIPNMLRRFTAEGNMTIAFIPVFTEYLKTRSREEAFELARNILTLLSIILVIITFAGFVCAPFLVRLIASGFVSDLPKYELTVLLTRITFPYIFLVSLVAFFMGVLNSLKHFAAPAAAPIFLNLGIIGATYLIAPHLSEPVIASAIGVLIGGGMQVLLQLPFIY